MHFHQAVEIVYLLDGILELRYESEQHVLRPNEFLLINSNVRHEYQGKAGKCLPEQPLLSDDLHLEFRISCKILIFCNDFSKTLHDNKGI